MLMFIIALKKHLQSVCEHLELSLKSNQIFVFFCAMGVFTFSCFRITLKALFLPNGFSDTMGNKQFYGWVAIKNCREEESSHNKLVIIFPCSVIYCMKDNKLRMNMETYSYANMKPSKNRDCESVFGKIAPVLVCYSDSEVLSTMYS